MRGRLLAGAVTALAVIAGNAGATIYTDGLNTESETRTIQELREIRSQMEADRNEKVLREAGMAAAAVVGIAAAAAAMLWWRRSRRFHSDRLIAGMIQAATDGLSQ